MLMLLLSNYLLFKQLLKSYPLNFVETEKTLQKFSYLLIFNRGIDEFIDLFLIILFDIYDFFSKKPQPHLANAPHKLILRI